MCQALFDVVGIQQWTKQKEKVSMLYYILMVMAREKKFINKLKVFERLYEMVTGAKEKMKLRMI